MYTKMNKIKDINLNLENIYIERDGFNCIGHDDARIMMLMCCVIYPSLVKQVLFLDGWETIMLHT